MKLNNPVAVDLRQFITQGRFDCIRPGQTREWILHNFPDPDSVNPMGHSGMSIWLYGNIELHFEGEMLYLIWCDNFRRLSAGENILLDKWFLSASTRVSLARVLAELHREKAGYTAYYNHKQQNATLRVLESGVDLHFDLTGDREYPGAGPGAFRFSGFGLSHPDYRMDYGG